MLLPSLTLFLSKALLLIDELTENNARVASFVGRARLDFLTTSHLIVTVFCQLSLFFLGIVLVRFMFFFFSSSFFLLFSMFLVFLFGYTKI